MRGRDLLLRVLYWLAVLAISLAILVGLIMFLESRDSSKVGSDSGARPPAGALPSP
jgi:hypothetical protein